MKKRRSPITNARYQGIAAALAVIARAEREPDIAASAMKELSLTVADLAAAGADPYDLEELEKAARS